MIVVISPLSSVARFDTGVRQRYACNTSWRLIALRGVEDPTFLWTAHADGRKAGVGRPLPPGDSFLLN
jgi:hypothetical protein